MSRLGAGKVYLPYMTATLLALALAYALALVWLHRKLRTTPAIKGLLSEIRSAN